jgi:hypothetical protein
MLASIMLVIVCGGSGDEQQARTFAAEGLRLARVHGDQWAQAEALTGLCWLNSASGRFAGQEATFDDMISNARHVQDPLTLAMALTNLAELRIWQGRHADATALLIEAMASFAGLGMVNAGAVCLHTIAFLATQLRQWTIAVQLQSASDAAMDSIDAGLWPPWLPRRQRLLTDARRHLGNTEYDQAYATGQSWTFDNAARQAGAALANLASLTAHAQALSSSTTANQLT